MSSHPCASPALLSSPFQEPKGPMQDWQADKALTRFIPLLLRQNHNIYMHGERDRPLNKHAERRSVALLLKCEV